MKIDESPKLNEPNHEEKRVSVSRENTEQNKEITIEKNTLVLLVGLPGSGKSTFAINHFPLDSIVSTDRIRQELSNNPRNQLVSNQAFIMANGVVRERLKHGEIVVVDAQNIKVDKLDSFFKSAEEAGSRVEAIFLNVGVEESIVRDQARKKKVVGARYIKRQRTDFAMARRALERSGHVDVVHSIEPHDTVDVKLPADDQLSFEADREILKEAEVSQAMLGTAETGFLRKEIKDGEPTLPLDAGSVLFVENENQEDTRKFFAKNFLPHQIIDARAVAKRLATHVGDEAVRDFMQFLLKHRVYSNLTTVITYPSEFLFADDLRSAIKESEAKHNVSVPMPSIKVSDAQITNKLALEEEGADPEFTVQIDSAKLSEYRVDFRRDAPEDAPLFLVGDVQGCYKAIHELASHIHRENIQADAVDQPKRTIVFVGDMADRGPYDAEAVIYIISLVRSGRAILVKGNHDENLLAGLKGEKSPPSETRKTIDELRRRLKPKSIQKIIETLERAPLYAEWQHLVVAHAALPRVPRREEMMGAQEAKDISHGKRSGEYTGHRAEVWKLHNTASHDPEILVVGGHTHEEDPVLDLVSGTSILDASVETKGTLWGMYYPELELLSAKEPSVVELFEILQSGNLPTGAKLLTFIEYARQQGFIDVKNGTGEYEGLLLTTYSGTTEASSLWEQYPTLRHFRGLIVAQDGKIVARPFEKTHKAGEEIPLDKLNIVPEKVFEKANGSLGIVYFWDEKWRVATKFSFQNDEYTRPAYEMLSHMNTDGLDASMTYLFEIILPNDSHIVDYGGKPELVLLNAIQTENGNADSWDKVQAAAEGLGTRTARDMTEQFRGMTIADIYTYAQTSHDLHNLEGMMAQYTDEQGKQVFVKVKTREYDDRKFVRDRLDWDKIFEAIDPEAMEMSEAAKEKLLLYNFDNAFANAALDARLTWIRNQYETIVSKIREFLFSPITDAELIYQEMLASGKDKKEAVNKTLSLIAPKLQQILKQSEQKITGGEYRTMMGFLRAILHGEQSPEKVLATYALARIHTTIEQELKKRGKNSFWVVPN